jgi:methyl-accepting chemotaxis protein
MAEEKGASAAKPGSRRRWAATRYRVVLSVGSLFAVLVAAMLVAAVLVLAFKADGGHLGDRGVPYASAVAAAALDAKGAANDQRGFLLTGDPTFIQEADHRIGQARAAFAVATKAAVDPAQRQAVRDAHAGFERWVRTVRGEFATFQAGDRRTAIAASLGSDRSLRKTYERSLATAQALGAGPTRATGSAMAASSRWTLVLLAFLLVVLVVGVGIAFRDDLA